MEGNKKIFHQEKFSGSYQSVPLKLIKKKTLFFISSLSLRNFILSLRVSHVQELLIAAIFHPVFFNQSLQCMCSSGSLLWIPRNVLTCLVQLFPGQAPAALTILRGRVNWRINSVCSSLTCPLRIGLVHSRRFGGLILHCSHVGRELRGLWPWGRPLTDEFRQADAIFPDGINCCKSGLLWGGSAFGRSSLAHTAFHCKKQQEVIARRWADMRTMNFPDHEAKQTSYTDHVFDILWQHLKMCQDPNGEEETLIKFYSSQV